MVQEQPVPQDLRVREETQEPQAAQELEATKDQEAHLEPMEPPDQQDQQEMLEYRDHQVSKVLRDQEDRQGPAVTQGPEVTLVQQGPQGRMDRPVHKEPPVRQDRRASQVLWVPKEILVLQAIRDLRVTLGLPDSQVLQVVPGFKDLQDPLDLLVRRVREVPKVRQVTREHLALMAASDHQEILDRLVQVVNLAPRARQDLAAAPAPEGNRGQEACQGLQAHLGRQVMQVHLEWLDHQVLRDRAVRLVRSVLKD